MIISEEQAEDNKEVIDKLQRELIEYHLAKAAGCNRRLKEIEL